MAGWCSKQTESREEENKKRRLDCTDTEDGLHSEFQRTHTESMSEFQVSGELPLSESYIHLLNTHQSTMECGEYGVFGKCHLASTQSVHTNILNDSSN